MRFDLRLLSAAAFANVATVLVPASEACRRLAITQMTLWRWLHGNHDRRSGRYTPPLADFPRPVVINSRRYWREHEITEFMDRRTAGSPSENAA